MTKRLYTAEKVLEAVLEDMDDDQDYDDPDEPVMEGSDDEFSDLELDEEETDADVDLPPPSSCCPPAHQLHYHHPHRLALCLILHPHLQHGQVC